jgi:hypothetical protein
MVDRVRFTERAKSAKQGVVADQLRPRRHQRDGRRDLVLPPARKAALAPGCCSTRLDGWKIWKEVKWPGRTGCRSTMATWPFADFDRDGNLDIASANHFKQAYVPLRGREGRLLAIQVPRHNPAVTSRPSPSRLQQGRSARCRQLAEAGHQLGTNRALKDRPGHRGPQPPGGWQLSPATFRSTSTGTRWPPATSAVTACPTSSSPRTSATTTHIFLNEKKGRASSRCVATRSLPAVRSRRRGRRSTAEAGAGRPRPHPDGQTEGGRALLPMESRLSGRRCEGQDSWRSRIGARLQGPERRVQPRFAVWPSGTLDGDKRPTSSPGAAGRDPDPRRMPDGRFAVQKTDSMA